MKNRTKRWLRIARNWGIFLGACLIIWIILLIARPNVTWGIIDRYFGSLVATFGFRDGRIAGVRMIKHAEDFLNEYDGWMGAEAIG